jgi:hypothetical protein
MKFLNTYFDLVAIVSVFLFCVFSYNTNYNKIKKLEIEIFLLKNQLSCLPETGQMATLSIRKDGTIECAIIKYDNGRKMVKHFVSKKEI